MLRTPLLLLSLFLLCGCERLGLADPAKEAAAREEESKAVGGACRHSGRALEDCYTLNPTAIKSAVFAGWREMNDYMTQNKIETVKPEYPSMVIPRKSVQEDASAKDAAGASEPAEQNAARRRARRIAIPPISEEKH